MAINVIPTAAADVFRKCGILSSHNSTEKKAAHSSHYQEKISIPVWVSSDTLMVEVTGDEDKLSSLLKLLSSFGVKEVCRTGRIAMTRGIINENGRRASKQSESSEDEVK